VPSEDYERLAGEGLALAERVEEYGRSTGRVLTVGMAAGKNAPRFTVTERGRGRVPLATWSPTWDGWLDKAEQDCLTAGLLPRQEDEMPAPTAEELERSNAMRPRIAALVEKAGGMKPLARRAAELVSEKNLEPFGGPTATTPAADVAALQLGKYLNPDTPSAMLTRNLDKWDAVLADLEREFGTAAPAPVVPAGTERAQAEPVRVVLAENVERLREQLAERDDELAEARRIAEERQVQLDGKQVDLRQATQELEQQRRASAELVRQKDEWERLAGARLKEVEELTRDRDAARGERDDLKGQIAGDAGHRSEGVRLERERRELVEAELREMGELLAEAKRTFEAELKAAEDRWDSARRELRERLEPVSSRELATTVAAPEGNGHDPTAHGWRERAEPYMPTVILPPQPSPTELIEHEVRRRYADQLLRQLERTEVTPDEVESIMRRLDRIAGLEPEPLAVA
jgi:DNA repair exonuclease SbcCD ATPase subunit